MPDALPNELGGKFIKADTDVVFPLASEDPEAVLEVILQREAL